MILPFVFILFSISISIIGSFSFDRRLVILYLFILLLIPSDAAYLFTGASYNAAPGTAEGTFRIHPLTMLMLIFLIVVLIVNPKKFFPVGKDRSKIFVWYILTFIGIISFETLIARGMKGSMQILENYIGPLVFFVIIIHSFQKTDDVRNYWIKTLLWFSLILSLFSIFEYITQLNPYNYFYDRSTDAFTFYTDTGYRSFTSLGHPLNNALFFLITMPFVFILSSNSKRIIVHLIQLLGILGTGSRVSLVIGVFFIFYFHVFFNKKHAQGKSNFKNIISVFVIFVATVIVIMYSNFGDVLLKRFFEDEASSMVRVVALQYFFDNWTSFLFHAMGIGGSSEISFDIMGTAVSFEIPWLLILADTGVIPLLMYLYSLFLPIKEYIKNRNIYGRVLIISYTLLMISATAYSSFGVKSQFNYIVFGTIACIYVTVREKSSIDFQQIAL